MPESSINLSQEPPRLRPSGAPRGSLKMMATRLADRNTRRDNRIKRARSMLAGQLTVPIPPKVVEGILKVAGGPTIAEALRVRLPQGTTVPLKTVNVLQRKRPRLHREQPLGVQARQRSTHIEKWTNAVLESVQAGGNPLLNWSKLIDLLFNEGEAAIVILPIDAHWEHLPSFEQVIHEAGGRELGRAIRPVYRVDEKGRGKRDDYYRKNPEKEFKADPKKSREFYEQCMVDFMARRLPWTARVLHATDCYPLWGPNDTLDGLLVRQVYARNDLIRRKFKWEGMSDHISPIDEDSGTNAGGPEVTVYEYYGYDEEGRPYMLVEVEGRDTWMESEEGQRVDAAVNLYERYGLTRLPCAYKYGWHFDTKDPQDRGIPFIEPFIQSLLGVDALATATVFHTWWLAFGGKFYKPDPELPAEAWLTETGPRDFDMKPMTFQALPGALQDVGNKNVGEDAHKMIALMAGATEQEIPGGGGQAFGAGAAQSGLDRSMMRNYLEDSVSQVLIAAKDIYEFAGEIILELACYLASTPELEDIGIPVYANVNPGPVDSHRSTRARRKDTKELLVLEAGDVGVSYDFTAFFPTKHGEYLAQGQQLAEFVKQELATFEEFREMVFGDEQPEETRIAIYVNKLLNSELGQQYIMELAMEYLGEDKMKRMVQAQQAGEMTQSGTPTAALTGVFPGNPGNVMSGMGRSSPGRQELGGAVAAGVGSRDAARVSAARSASGSGAEQLGA